MKKQIVATLALFLALTSTYAQTTDFFTLVKTGTPQSVQAAISKGADVNAQDKYGSTALMYAAAQNPNPEVITTLLKAGADLEARDKEGWTALMAAAKYNPKPNVTTVLLKAGADIKAQSSESWTALMYAAGYNQNPLVITALLVAHPDINARNKAGQTPLMTAAANNSNPDVITTLLKAGANINDRDSVGTTPLMYAASYCKNPAVIAVLIKAGANAKLKTDSGDSALAYAQNNQSLKGTQQLSDLEKASMPEKTNPGIGEVVRAGYFDVKVNSIAIKDRVSTGNEFADLKPEEGTKYLIMSVTFKNVANEPGTLFDGTLSVNSGTQIYKIDQSETIMLDGWGLFLDRLNPLVSKTTKLVYKLGSEMKGMAYWQPTGADQTFFIGNIK